MSIVATKKHPYVSEGVEIHANIFNTNLLVSRGYAIEVDADAKPKTPKEIKPKTPKK